MKAARKWEDTLEENTAEGCDAEEGLTQSPQDRAVTQEAARQHSAALHSTLEMDIDLCVAKLQPRERLIAKRIFMGHDTFETLAKELDCPLSTLGDEGKRCQNKLGKMLAQHAPSRTLQR